MTQVLLLVRKESVHACKCTCLHKVCAQTLTLSSTPLSRLPLCFAEAEATNKDEKAKTKTISEGEMRSLVSHKENKPLVRLNMYFWINTNAHSFQEDVKH